ncbi:hypothetical protein FIBSPDRAFT_964314 [Athelia psychrophila]|uniref:Uncharacterized protein n=1 Tax=Athelia psychrophila TaxID=1759441 RepID=A0A165XW54_9AGAM|nr:hypothetical protein FIBSPDRAFT_964314 [Fibularhizoctonia sp. CBS 109695]
MEPQAKSPAKKARSNRAPKTNEIANTPQKSKPKNTRKKAVQDENTNPAPPTAQQTAGQSKKKGSAVDDVEAPGDSPDHTALLARIRELEGEFDMLWNDESTKLNKQSSRLQNKPVKLIADPGGTAGSQYNLQTTMGLGGDDQRYTAIRRGVRAIADKSGMDYRVEWGKQPQELVGKIFRIARNRFPFLGQFSGDWATKELVKARMKNRRAYCVRLGYNQTDFGMNIDHMFDDDEGAAQSAGEGEAEDGFGGDGMITDGIDD